MTSFKVNDKKFRTAIRNMIGDSVVNQKSSAVTKMDANLFHSLAELVGGG